jgi:uncharacterized protein
VEHIESPEINPDWALVLKRCVDWVRLRYRLRWEGLHGSSHWARVLENGLRLAASTPEIRMDVVTSFAVLHDSCRRNDLVDPRHGARAALLVRDLSRQGILPMDEDGLALLEKACRTHTGGRIPDVPTVMACWDSDRLDLPRIAGVEVRVDWLGTPLARASAFVEAATQRARAKVFPYRHIFYP